MIPQLEKIIISWFYEFSENNRMLKEHCANFVYKCTGEKCQIEDSRVYGVFEQFDTKKQGFLELSDFLQFYQCATRERPLVVWKNLYAFHYRNDLQKNTDICTE